MFQVSRATWPLLPFALLACSSGNPELVLPPEGADASALDAGAEAASSPSPPATAPLLLRDPSDAAPEACASMTVQVVQQPPTVMLLIDQSGSMTNLFSGGSRWAVLRDALLDADQGMIETLQHDVWFGLTLFTGLPEGACPSLTQMQPGIDNYLPIKEVYEAASPLAYTPTAEALAAVASQLRAAPVPGPKLIILATDGEPDTCTSAEPQKDETVAAAQSAYAMGIETFLIAVGADLHFGHVQDLANAGIGWPVGGPQNAVWYQPQDQSGIVNAFEAIVLGHRACSFELQQEQAPWQVDGATVLLDGAALPRGGADGWMREESAVHLAGEACETMKRGTHTIEVVLPCIPPVGQVR